MSGIRLTIPMKFTKARPVLRADTILPAAGALLLYDAAHGAGAWPSGKANGMVLPNIAADQASKLTGSPLNGVLEYAGANMALSRTPKGGLHVAPDSVAPLPAGNYARFNVPAALAEYIHNNLSHSYYLSQWTRATRISPGGGVPTFTGTIHQGSAAYLGSMWRNSNLDTYPRQDVGNEQLLGRRTEPVTLGQPNLGNIAVSKWTGTAPETPAQIYTLPFMLGMTGAIRSANSQPALIVYRCYLEDLTVSGRSYTEADAADAEAYTREVRTAGGRYYGDTYTAPTN